MALEQALDNEAASQLLVPYSLEMTVRDVEALSAASALIPPSTCISITSLPGEDLEARVAAARAVRQRGFVPVPHIAARRLKSREELDVMLSRLAEEARIDRAFVIAGDAPEARGPYHDALAVIDTGLLERHGVRRVGIGGYPEGHPEIDDGRLWTALFDKTRAIHEHGMAAEIVTQFGFDASAVLDWLRRLREAGVEAPVRVGLPGPASVRTLLRFAARCGVAASAGVLKKYGVSITRLMGTAGPDRILADLADGVRHGAHGEVGIHLYPFGGLMATVEWAAECRGAQRLRTARQ